jgi:hypothetical protein
MRHRHFQKPIHIIGQIAEYPKNIQGAGVKDVFIYFFVILTLPPTIFRAGRP